MAASHEHPTDVLLRDLLHAYAAGARGLEGIVQAALRRGVDPSRVGGPSQQRGDATAGYRARQLAQARAVLADLDRQALTLAPVAVGRAYGGAVLAVDSVLRARGLGRTRVLGSFGGIHVTAANALIGQLTDSLSAAASRAGTNTETVFARASMLEGAIPPSGRVAGVRFLGRRVDDPWRRLALDVTAGGVIGGDTHRDVAAELARRLVSEGVTDASTAFVDAAGRRWSLDSYASMVARTTTREATTAATANRMLEHGLDLVTISRHRHPADECSQWEGRTFSLRGLDTRYPRLVVRPPFHPNCAHVMGPAAGNLDDFERGLAVRARP
jgi:hypothetical protein